MDRRAHGRSAAVRPGSASTADDDRDLRTDLAVEPGHVGSPAHHLVQKTRILNVRVLFALEITGIDPPERRYRFY